MAEQVSEEGFSLKKAWKTFTHVRHTLMDVSMITFAIGALVATGGVVGILDPVSIFLQMHIPSIEHLAAIGDFASTAFENASNGFFMTENAWLDPHSLHAGHAAAAAAPAAPVAVNEMMGFG
jgi:hypothetical protein